MSRWQSRLGYGGAPVKPRVLHFALPNLWGGSAMRACKVPWSVTLNGEPGVPGTFNHKRVTCKACKATRIYQGTARDAARRAKARKEVLP